MTKRSYRQFCPIAYSLDLIGERWTLLLIRELIFGPRRFTDLLRGLPGIGKNLLSQRLKDLEAAGVIRQRTLSPPAPATVYELTDQGQTLRKILNELTWWGLPFIAQGSLQDDHLGVVPLMNALTILFDSEAASKIERVSQFHVAGEVFHTSICQGHLTVGPGPAESPYLVIQTDAKTLIMLLVEAMDLQQTLAEGLVEIKQGDQGAFSQFMTLFRFPETAEAGLTAHLTDN